ncbi:MULTISPECIES: ABC transporter substrate-binding protein [unclassified Pseudactinotalea]|uniref:ABC transporter substrate-binding protein n=1 Tax=unclassified Pseudactinotalea TaxID=2649176 RepID=UPI00128BEF62|nr:MULTISPECIES: sugar ABC transporter substrate-binding protein [unclassified Pseudactinotalea]MPV48767.1 extracellular solute-binding protein [Pseudactinotalea sp. HY160]QGH68754.1 extracellular solute-binding protein [Pseudactinotalea sp. HY158]
MNHQAMRRAAAVSVATLMGVGALTACGGGDDGGGGASDTVKVTLANHVWTEAIKKKIPDFEKESGLTVEVSQLSEDQLADSYKVKLNAGSSDFDVMMYRPLQVGKLFGKSNFLADLGDKVTEDPDWNWDDFQDGPVSLTTYKDTVVGVPLITESEVLYYRKDLLEQAGIDVPTTMKELEAAAKQISEENDGVAGFVSRTQASAAVTQFSGFLYSFGGTWTDGNDNATINTDEAKAAYAFYGKLLREYGPDQLSTDMSWPEAMAIFQQGKAAFETDASSLYDNLGNPDKSKVADDVGVAAFPAGPAGSKPYNVAAWALGINANSENQDNAWTFIKWATSPDMTLEMQKEGTPSARTSVWDNPDSTADLPDDLVAAIAANGKNGVGTDRPLVVNVAEAREIVGTPIVVAITGGDSDAAAETANSKFQDLLDSEK